MRKILLFVLLLNVFALAESCDIKPLPPFLDSPQKQALAKVRDSLLTSLQAQDSNEVFRYVDVLRNSGYGERALDNYELIQIYFLMNQYDSALVTLVREHYRFINDSYVDDEICIGDYVISSGEIASLVIVDAVYRLFDGVISKESLEEESFSNGLLEYPQYTRPEVFRGMKVPDVLLSGHHKNIRDWRLMKSLEKTKMNRPDLLGPEHIGGNQNGSD